MSEERRIMAPTLHMLLRMPFYAFKYRDRQSIISDILWVVSRSNKGRKKSQIMQAARLNTFQANRYLELCLRNGYVIVDGIQYKLSGRGLEYLENIEREIIKVQWSQR
jgi:predicted transcriptional regulator